MGFSFASTPVLEIKQKIGLPRFEISIYLAAAQSEKELIRGMISP
tara:strand:- start:344 stop:478 length:135 start_codon:yes stop_codon:yes gene_type:complete